MHYLNTLMLGMIAGEVYSGHTKMYEPRGSSHSTPRVDKRRPHSCYHPDCCNFTWHPGGYCSSKCGQAHRLLKKGK